MLQRFRGTDGRARLVEALEIQPIISGDTATAEAISGRVEVKSFEPGSGIIEESAPDNDLCFILAGANPRLWRNVARVLADRLRERNRFVSPSNPRPAMFVGCSTEPIPRNVLYDSRACGQIPRHSGPEPESSRFESNNDLMHILINPRCQELEGRAPHLRARTK